MSFRKWIPALVLLFPAGALAFTLTTANMKGWNKEEVKFRFNSANCSASVGRIETAIRDSVDLWNSVPTSRLRVTYSGQTSDTGSSEEPIISCVTSGMSGSVGVGIISTVGGVIISGEIQLNSEPGDAGDIASTNDAQLGVALAHEMGHVFGLGHSTVESALMYFSLGQKQRLALSQDDIDGITWLYPRVEPKDGMLGCGSLSATAGGPGPGGLLWVLAAAGMLTLALRGRVREPRYS